ncbi:MAG: NAD(P)/FAD-dependent oxidoreductase [Gammaproteobacteria bacterium]|nr:NAD(P)/FAD-dependent oxidoreductase [Gammaproteobacteria bacterium]
MHDVIVIGAGPAGLAAAVYLGRFRRQPVVLDSGDSRARWIPRSRNVPGFPQGVAGPALLRKLRSQAQKYGAQLRRCEEVTGLARLTPGFRLQLGRETLQSRFVLLATGVKDLYPSVRGVPAAQIPSLMRVCPICDGLEAQDRRIAVIGNGPHGEREAEFLRTYSPYVTYIHMGTGGPSGPSRGITRVTAQPEQLEMHRGKLRLRASRGGIRRFDVAYAALGCQPRNALARRLGAATDESGFLKVDAHQQTSVAGLYAAGDIVRGLNQVVVAAAEAVIAATHIHNQLRAQGLPAGVRRNRSPKHAR